MTWIRVFGELDLTVSPEDGLQLMLESGYRDKVGWITRARRATSLGVGAHLYRSFIHNSAGKLSGYLLDTEKDI